MGTKCTKQCAARGCVHTSFYFVSDHLHILMYVCVRVCVCLWLAGICSLLQTCAPSSTIAVRTPWDSTLKMARAVPATFAETATLMKFSAVTGSATRTPEPAGKEKCYFGLFWCHLRPISDMASIATRLPLFSC